MQIPRPFLLLLLLFLPLGVASFAGPEEGNQNDFGTYTQRLSITVKPEDAERWEGAVRHIVQAAGKSQLPAKHHWLMYREGPFRYRLILFSDGFADIDTLESFAAGFAKTEGEGLFRQAIEELKPTQFEVLDIGVRQQVYSWSTVRSMNTDTHPLARVIDYWIRPGSRDEFDTVMREYAALLKRIEYPYPVEGFRWRLFAPGMYSVVTFPDDWSKFHGENRLELLARKKGAFEQLLEIRRRLAATLIRHSQFDLDFASELSYSP